MSLEANITSLDQLKHKGDAAPYRNDELGYLQLAIVCPQCGEVSASAGKHKYDPKTKTVTPSLVHDKELGGCGWHGWLRNGVFTDIK